MVYYGNDVKYKGFYQGVKSIVLLHERLLIQFDNGRVISYALDGVPKILFDENE